MWPSLKPSQRVALAAVLSPQSATTAQTSAWVDASKYENLLAVVGAGAITATGLVDAKLRQAQDATGTGAKDITGAAITEWTAAANANNQAMINLNAGGLDTNNGYTFVALVITPSVAAALIYGEIWGFDAKLDAPAQPAAVVQTVG